MTEYYPSVFWKSKYKSSKEPGYQGTDYNRSFNSKKEARAEARNQINKFKSQSPEHAKHLKFSAHVASIKESKSRKNIWF